MLRNFDMKRFVKPLILALGFMGSCAAGELSEQERWEFIQQKFVEEPGKTWTAFAGRHSEKLSIVAGWVLGLRVKRFIMRIAMVYPQG
jgi:hypothetical protein